MHPFIAPLLIPYPKINPVLWHFGPFEIRWYALAYIAGLLIGWRYLIVMSRRPGSRINERDADDFLLWATLGVVLGGRLGYILFYQPGYYFAHPLQMLYVWHGGMSFHGGFIGVAVAVMIFSRLRRIPALDLGDLVAQIAPIGLFFGRIANFINGELFGRPANVWWAMIFPKGGPIPRYPSELIEASLEGIALFIVLWLARRYAPAAKHHGFLIGVFCTGYGIARCIGEEFRQPDPFLGYLWGGLTMGQILSIPMIFIGIFVMWWVTRVKTAKA
jgi:phosphatidylglycerol:prolipoprotein diacylglycerol transferase